MEQKKNNNGHGGARPGAGRKPGSGNKIRLEDLMMDVEFEANMPFTKRLAINYVSAINREDWSRVENYDRAFLNKLVSDKIEVETIESEDQVEAKRRAFAEALAAMTAVATKAK